MSEAQQQQQQPQPVDLTQYVNEHLALHRQGKAVDLEKVIVTLFNGASQIIAQLQQQVAALTAANEAPTGKKQSGQVPPRKSRGSRRK